MKEILFATSNKSKINRFTKGLLTYDIKILTPEDISINIKLNKYFTDLTEEDKLLINEDETNVVKFIVTSLITSEQKKDN